MKRWAVLGLGISGKAVLSFLVSQQEYVIGIDRSSKIEAIKKEFPHQHLIAEEGFHEDFDVLVVSPGIHPSHSIYQRAKENGIEIIGEIELAMRFLSHRMIGITGTNGKTTTTLCVAHVLKQSGYPVQVAGNIGLPLISCIGLSQETILVVELSSFQLETMQTGGFLASAILNVTPDHLERYSCFEEYLSAKLRLVALTQEGHCYGHVSIAQDLTIHPIGPGNQKQDWMSHEMESVAKTLDGKGAYEQEYLLFIHALTERFGVTPQNVSRALGTFIKPRHRLELVKNVNGVSFINDSKGTNVDAVIYAVQSVEQNKILLVGGRDKHTPFSPWKSGLNQNVKAIIAFGEAKEKIQRDLAPVYDVICHDCLSKAFSEAVQMAKKGEIGRAHV